MHTLWSTPTFLSWSAPASVGVGEAADDMAAAACRDRGGQPSLDEDGSYLGCEGDVLDPAAVCANEGGTWCPDGFCAPPGEACPVVLNGLGEVRSLDDLLNFRAFSKVYEAARAGLSTGEILSYLNREDVLDWIRYFCPAIGFIVGIVDKAAGHDGILGTVLHALCSSMVGSLAGDVPQCPVETHPVFDEQANFLGCHADRTGADCQADDGLPGTLLPNGICGFNASRITSRQQGDVYCGRQFGAGHPAHFATDADGNRFLAGCCPEGTLPGEDNEGCRCPDGNAWSSAGCVPAASTEAPVSQAPSQGLISAEGPLPTPASVQSSRAQARWPWLLLGTVSALGLGALAWRRSQTPPTRNQIRLLLNRRSARLSPQGARNG